MLLLLLLLINLTLYLLVLCLLDGDVISGPDAETLMDTTQTRNLLIDELLEVQADFISIVLNFCFGLLLSITGLWRGTHLTLFYFQKLLSVELLRSQS